MKQLSRIAPIVLVAGAALLGGCSQQESTASPALPPVAASAASLQFSFPDLEGKERQLREWQGQVVVLNFWAPWCPPCRAEMPALLELQQKHAAAGLAVVGITIDTQENAQNFVDEMGIDFPILIAEDRGIVLAQKLGNRVGVLPYTVVLDRQGQVVYTHRSEITLEQAEAAVLPLL